MALTDKGKEVLAQLGKLYTIGDSFKTKDAQVNAASLKSLITDGYIEDLGGKPKTYKIISLTEKITIKTDYKPYSLEEWNLQRTMSYSELCSYLRDKYGYPDGNYFLKDNCKSPNGRIKRGGENLEIHHIREDKCINLNRTEMALLCPWEYQMSDALVYANPYEHLLLHMMIAYEYERNEDTMGCVGIGGVINFIAPKLLIEGNFLNLDIMNIIEKYENILKDRPIYSGIIMGRVAYAYNEKLQELDEDAEVDLPLDFVISTDSFKEGVQEAKKLLIARSAFIF